MDQEDQKSVLDANRPVGGSAAERTVGPDGRPLTDEDKELLAKYSNTFIGSYGHSLDGKGRMVVPQAFRDRLGQNFYICPSLDLRSISLYTELDWARQRDYLEKLGQISSRFKEFLFIFDQLSYRNQECDQQGRVLLPAKIRQLVLGDNKDVEICGANDHIRISVAADNEARLKAALEHASDLTALYDELSKMMLHT